MSKQFQILLLEDNPGDARLIREFLNESRTEKFSLVHVTHLAAGLEHLKAGPPDAILLDLGLPDSQGLGTLETITSQSARVPIVVLTGLNDMDMAGKAMQAGAQDYLVKGEFAGDFLIRILRYAIERKQAENVLAIIERRANQLIQNAPDGIVLINLDGNITFASPSARKIFGFCDEEISQINPDEYTHPDDLAKVSTALDHLIRNPGQTPMLEYRYKRKDGSWVWVESTFTNLLNEPSVGAIVINFRDITARIQMESALRINEADLKKAQQIAHVGSWKWDIQTNQVEWSDEMFRIFGVDPTHFSGNLNIIMQKSIHPDDIEAVMASNLSVIEQNKPIPLEYRIILPNGEMKVVWAEAGEIQLDDAGQPGFLTGIVQDITEIKRQKNEILKRNQEINLLYEAGKQISESLDLENIYLRFYESISQNMKCDTMYIASFDAQTELISAEFAVIEGKQAEVSGFPVIPLEPEGQGIQSPVIRSGNAQRINDTQEALKTTSTKYYIDEGGSVADEGHVPEDGQYTQSSLIIPMKLKNQVIGVVQIQSYEKNAYSEDDFRIAQSLVSQITMAANNALLYQQSLQEIEHRKQAENIIYQQAAELKINNERLTRLYRVSNSLIQGSALNRERLIHLIADTIATEIGEICCSIYLRIPDTNQLALTASSGLVSENCSPTAVDLKQAPLFVRAFLNKEKINIGELGQKPFDVSLLKDTHSVYLTPLEAGQKAFGVIMIQSPEAFFITPEDEQFLTLFTSQAAIVLENANLITEITKQVSRLESLRKIDETINASMDLKLTAEVLLTQISSQLNIDAVDLLHFDPGAQSLNFVKNIGFKTAALQHTNIHLGHGLAGQAAIMRQTLHVNNLNEQNDFLDASPLLREENFIEYFGVPLIAKGKLKGMLEIYHRSHLTINESWLNFLEALAGQAAIAMDNIDLFSDLQKSINELVLAYDENIEAWSRALDLRDEETEGHTQRVVKTTIRLAKAMGINGEDLVHIRRGSLLHDIGKMGIPDDILLKPGPLTADEWEIMRKHPVYAYELLSPIMFLRPALDIPYCHHEQWDGSGYPRGLIGEQIPLAARIFAIVDVWDALRSDRPYRASWPEEKVIEYILGRTGSQFDPQIVALFFNSELFQDRTSGKPTILIVDDEENVTRLLACSLEDRFSVLTANNGFDALKIIQRSDLAVVLTDQRMPGMTGVELLEKSHKYKPNTCGILMSGYSDAVALTAAINLRNVRGFIPKPWDLDHLQKKLDEAVNHYRNLERRSPDAD